MHSADNVDIWMQPSQRGPIHSKLATAITNGAAILVLAGLVATGFIFNLYLTHGRPTSVCDGEILTASGCMVAEWQICKDEYGLIVLLMVFDGGGIQMKNPHWLQFNAGPRYVGEWNPEEPSAARGTRKEWITFDGRREFDGASDASGAYFGGHFFEFRIPWVMRN
jgi:hypothetical protein